MNKIVTITLLTLLAMTIVAVWKCNAETSYLTTVDPNIIQKVTTTTIEVNLEELQQEIDILNEQIETMPDMIEMPSGKEELIRIRDEKVDYINSITVPIAISK